MHLATPFTPLFVLPPTQDGCWVTIEGHFVFMGTDSRRAQIAGVKSRLSESVNDFDYDGDNLSIIEPQLNISGRCRQS
jgi:hypothetical protein